MLSSEKGVYVAESTGAKNIKQNMVILDALSLNLFFGFLISSLPLVYIFNFFCYKYSYIIIHLVGYVRAYVARIM